MQALDLWTTAENSVTDRDAPVWSACDRYTATQIYTVGHSTPNLDSPCAVKTRYCFSKSEKGIAIVQAGSRLTGLIYGASYRVVQAVRSYRFFRVASADNCCHVNCKTSHILRLCESPLSGTIPHTDLEHGAPQGWIATSPEVGTRDDVEEGVGD